MLNSEANFVTAVTGVMGTIFLSQPIKLRPRSFAACMTTKLPAAGSTTRSFGLRNSSDQPCNQSDRFDVRMNLAIDLLDPSIGNPVISPGTFCGEW